MVDFSKYTGVEKQAYVNAYVDDGTLHLLYRDEKGELREKKARADYSLYLAMDDVESRGIERKLRQSDFVEEMKREGEWLRVRWKNSTVSREYKDKVTGKMRKRPVQYRDLMAQDPDSPFKKWGVQTYEGDVHPVRRFMIDNQTHIQKPRRLYFDLEADSRVPFAKKEEARILSWTVEDDDGKKSKMVLAADTDDAERELLLAFWKIAENYDQLIAWNGDRYDFPVIENRTVLRKIDINFRRWLFLDHLVLFKRMNVTASESGDEKTSMKLQDVAMAVVGEGKDNFNGAMTWFAWSVTEASSAPCPGCGAVHEDYSPRECMLRYNEKDTHLLRRIEEKTGYIELFFTLCDACGIFPDSRGTNPLHQVDSFLLRLGLEKGVHFKTMVYGDRTEEHEQYKGAMVADPPKKAGVIQDCHVADFARLYPSIIITWNMSPETKHSLVIPPKEIPEGCSRAPFTNVCFKTDKQGILPLALFEMIRLRKFWADKKASFAPGTPEWVEADRRSTAYKIAANSFYGVIGSVFSRYFDRQVGESVTQAGVYLIQRTRDEAQKRGWRVIYIDTDSIFVLGPTKDEFKAFCEWCNKELYPQLVKKLGCIVNDISVAYEKQFARLVFTGKKRYAGKFVHYKGKAADKNSKPEIKGLEFKRGDTAKLARQLQEKIITEVITAECDDALVIEAMVEEMKKYVLEAPVKLDECALSKSLGKEIEQFVVKKKLDGTDQALPAQVQIAKMLKERGQEVFVGTKIKYIVCDGSTSPMKYMPADDFTGVELDRFYLWENLVFPPTQRFVEEAFPEFDWRKHEKVRPKKERKKPVRKPKVALDAEGVAQPVFEHTHRPPVGGEAPKKSARRIRSVTITNPGGIDARQPELPFAPIKLPADPVPEAFPKEKVERVRRQMREPQLWIIGAPKAASS